MPQRLPTPSWKPNHRLNGQGSNYGLRAGQTFGNTNVRYEVVSVSGMAKITARIKTATQGGTLDIFFIGPDVDVDALLKNDTAYAAIVGTIYTSGNATQGAVVAGTEQLVTVACSGEDYAIIKFTGGGTGTVTYCDVAALSVGLS
jgi:hypothetical protein